MRTLPGGAAADPPPASARAAPLEPTDSPRGLGALGWGFALALAAGGAHSLGLLLIWLAAWLGGGPEWRLQGRANAVGEGWIEVAMFASAAVACGIAACCVASGRVRVAAIARTGVEGPGRGSRDREPPWVAARAPKRRADAPEGPGRGRRR